MSIFSTGALCRAVAALLLVSLAPPLSAKSADATQGIPLYGKKTPGSVRHETRSCTEAGICTFRNVTFPTVTPFLPSPDKATGAAVLVLPGGGFMSLAADVEGFNVARALADRGIAAFVLKYRLNKTPVDDAEARTYMGKQIMTAIMKPNGAESLANPEAYADAKAAMRFVRDRAAQWGVDPARVGMIGFSAGARTALNTVLTGTDSERPAFFGYIYGEMVSRPVPADAPPMFAAFAFDDMLYPGGNVTLAQDWYKAKRPVEVHVYEKGNHGFGLGLPGTSSTLMIDEFLAWLDMQGVLKPKAKP